MDCMWNCQQKILQLFYSYGYFVAHHLIWFIIIPILVCVGLGFGMLQLDVETDMETLYAPMLSRAIRDRDIMINTFPDHSGHNYVPMSSNRFDLQGLAIFRSKKNHAILTADVLNELQEFNESVFSISVKQDGKNYTYKDVCARAMSSCFLDGAFVLLPGLRSLFDTQQPNFPEPFQEAGLSHGFYFGDVIETNGVLVSAGSLKWTFALRHDTAEKEKLSLAWELEYLKFMKTVNFTTLDVAYSVSQSLNMEVNKGTGGDILYFSLTFTLMITYASVVSSGGDCVSTRALLANAGVLSTVFGITGAFGLATLMGFQFVNIVGAMPFLVLGIGVDDMFLLMNSWSETTSVTDLTIPERIGLVFKKAGIGITITSMTDFLAFAFGTTSVFRSVRNFCAYSGIAVVLCYICNATFFGACLTLHGYRVYSNRHTITCKVLEKSRSELRIEGRSYFYALLCGGTYPKKPSDDQSLFITWNPVRIITLIFFAGYLAVSIWGCTFLKQGLDLTNLVPPSSYFYKYQTWDKEDFDPKFPISFVTTTTKDYRDPQTLKDIQDLYNSIKKYPSINPSQQSCWLLSFSRSHYCNTSSDAAFFAGLHRFLVFHPKFQNDIVFGPSKMSITASRCQIYTYKITDSNEQAELMINMRDIADSSPADVFAYHPAFVFFEQYVSIMPSTLKTVGMTLAVMFVVTCIFLPHPLMVILTMIQVVMIVIGIFGFMSIWGLTLSSITMIHLIMSVGFSVDFCAHVCTAYMISEKQTRLERSQDAIVHASGPILNGGMSSLIGIIVLLLSESYVFQSFFKIMLLVISFGVLHAVFLVPVILSFIGPKTHVVFEDGLPNDQNTVAININKPASRHRSSIENETNVTALSAPHNKNSKENNTATVGTKQSEKADVSVNLESSKLLETDDHVRSVKDKDK